MDKNEKIKKVLIIEDEVITAHGIAQTLEDLGYKPMGPALSGKDALELIAKEKPDMVLVDIELKDDEDGIQLSEKIRKLCDMPIIFITAYTDKKTFNRAMEAGAFGYLAKPFQDRDLEVAVEIAFYKYKYEKILLESRMQYKILAEQVKDLIVRLDADGNMIYCSPVSIEFGGYSPEDVQGTHFSNYMADKSEIKQAQDIIDKIANLKDGIDFSFTYKPNTGKPFRVELSAKPLIVDGVLKSIQLVLRK